MRVPLWLFCAALGILLGCGPAAPTTSTAHGAAAHSVDPGTLFVAEVRWSPSEVTALGVVPAFPRDTWVAITAADGYVRHARVGGPSRHECDDCIGARMALVTSIDEPASTPYAVGPAERRLPRVALVTESPFDRASTDERWAATATFDLDEDGTADLERVERCGASVLTGCDDHACTRRCAATRTVGQTTVRGELCTTSVVVPRACIPQLPAPEIAVEPVAEPEVAPEGQEEEVSPPSEPETGRGRHWGSRRRPR
jgi:hypothetical protein